MMFIQRICNKIFKFIEKIYKKYILHYWKKLVKFVFDGIKKSRISFKELFNFLKKYCLNKLIAFQEKYSFYFTKYRTIYKSIVKKYLSEKVYFIIYYVLNNKLKSFLILLSFCITLFSIIYFFVYICYLLTVYEIFEVNFFPKIIWKTLQYCNYLIDIVTDAIKFVVNWLVIIVNTVISWCKAIYAYIKYFTIDKFFNDLVRFKNFLMYDLSALPLFFFGFTLFISSTLISMLFLSYLGLYGVFIFNFITIVIFWILTIIYFDSFFYENLFVKVNVGKWFTVLNNIDVLFEFYIDAVSYSFLLLTITIATAVYVYVYSYFRYEPNIERLSLLINLFVISMIVLVMSGNFFVLFFGWELIGITSFLLINFWSTKISSLKSAFKAYTFNKFSDLALFLAVIYSFLLINDSSILVFNFQIVEYLNYYLTTPFWRIQMIELISFLFITAAFVKSAQFGFHIWLPDSMDAPVPASALIHSATLVSAGVFVLLRFTTLFELSVYATYIIPLIGSFTAFVGGLGAVYQSDVKRILAYSTISHCGFLMVCFSLHVPEYTILYLYIHGFFKAAVFLCAGNIIRFSRNYQDFRKMGSFWKYLPFEFYCSFICLSNLCGLPFTIGFYIKHLILVVLNNDDVLSLFVLINIFCAAIFGLIYSYKFFYYIFLDKKKTNKYVYAETNRFNLSSVFYSNSMLASICAISFLILISFFISFLLFNCFLKKNSIGESLDINIFYNFSYLELNWPSLNLLQNIGYFNWFIIITIFSLILNNWRIVRYLNFNSVFWFVIFFICIFYVYTFI